MIKELADYIKSKTSFIPGTTLQVNNEIPTAPDRCIIMLDDIGGKENFYVPSLSEPYIRFVAKSINYDEAITDINIIRTLFHRREQFDLPVVESGKTYKIQFSYSGGRPQYIGVDEKRRHQYQMVVNFFIKEV